MVKTPGYVRMFLVRLRLFDFLRQRPPALTVQNNGLVFIILDAGLRRRAETCDERSTSRAEK